LVAGTEFVQDIARLAAAPDRQVFVPAILSYLKHQEGRFMLPTSLSPVK
jgi:hypothetical protein